MRSVYRFSQNLENALTVINEVFKERDISLPLEKQGTVTEENRHEKGAAVQDRLYPGGISQVMEDIPGEMGDDVERFLTEYRFVICIPVADLTSRHVSYWDIVS